MLCKACVTYFLSAEAALVHECPKEDEYREYVGLSNRESPTEAPPEAEAPTQEPEATAGFDFEAFSAWINEVVIDRNRLRDEIEVARIAISEAEDHVLRLKAEVSHQQTVAERFRTVVLARETADDFGDYHIRKSAAKG